MTCKEIAQVFSAVAFSGLLLLGWTWGEINYPGNAMAVCDGFIALGLIGGVTVWGATQLRHQIGGK